MQFRNQEYDRKRRRIWGVISLVAIVGVTSMFIVLKKTDPLEESVALKWKLPQAEGRESRDPGKPSGLTEMVKQVKPMVVSIEVYDKDNKISGMGSGFFINQKGQVVTNRHVIIGAHHTKVKTSFGTFTVKKYIAGNPKCDLAMLSIDREIKDLSGIRICSEMPEVGEKVFVIGNPLGLELTVSDGIVSAVRELEPFGKVIQVTSPISPGSSGSPVMNMKGELVGVATLQMIQGQNLNFAIPIERVSELDVHEGKWLSKMQTTESEAFTRLNDPLERGIFLYEKHEYKDAIPLFKEAADNDLLDSRPHYYLGCCYKNLEMNQAVDEFQRAVDINPGYVEAYFELGESYVGINALDKGIECYKKALEHRPDYYEAMIRLSGVYTLQKNYKTALKTLEDAFSINESVDLHIYRGICYSELAEHLKAIRSFQRAIEIDDERMDVYTGLIYALLKVRNFKLGISYIEEALVKAQDHPELHFLKGLLHLGNNDLPTARNQLQILGRLKAKEAAKFRNELHSAIIKYENLVRRSTY